ncbi:MAG: hypothetical protein ACE5GT_10980 [Rhodospirillales bacterium]
MMEYVVRTVATPFEVGTKVVFMDAALNEHRCVVTNIDGEFMVISPEDWDGDVISFTVGTIIPIGGWNFRVTASTGKSLVLVIHALTAEQVKHVKKVELVHG